MLIRMQPQLNTLLSKGTHLYLDEEAVSRQVEVLLGTEWAGSCLAEMQQLKKKKVEFYSHKAWMIKLPHARICTQ